jgi:hypothetical protein
MIAVAFLRKQAKIDEKLLSYSDLQTEADDLYAKHGFRTYVVPRYPIFYDLSDLGEAEYRKDALARIKDLNTDGKPYIVVDLNLEKDLDFKGEVIASSWVGYTGLKGNNAADRASGLDEDTKKAIELHAAANINYQGDKKLNPTETANGINDFKWLLTPAYPNGDPNEYFDNSLDITKVRSLVMEGFDENISIDGANVISIYTNIKGLLDYIRPKKANNPYKSIADEWIKYEQIIQNNQDEAVQKLKITNKISTGNGFDDIEEIIQNSKDFANNSTISDKAKIISYLDKISKKIFDPKGYKYYWNTFLEENGDIYGWHRFDKYFESNKVTQVLNFINGKYGKYLTLTPAELKAYFAQESGDYAIPNLLGITDNPANTAEFKTKGYLNAWKTGNKSYAGITQMSKTSIEEAAKWLKDNVGINDIDETIVAHNVQLWNNDKKEYFTHTYNLQASIAHPEDAILLGEAYMGVTLDLLFKKPNLKKTPNACNCDDDFQVANAFVLGCNNAPKGVDMKNILFAAYNTGHCYTKLITRKYIKCFTPNCEADYSWDNYAPYYLNADEKDTDVCCPKDEKGDCKTDENGLKKFRPKSVKQAAEITMPNVTKRLSTKI